MCALYVSYVCLMCVLCMSYVCLTSVSLRGEIVRLQAQTAEQKRALEAAQAEGACLRAEAVASESCASLRVQALQAAQVEMAAEMEACGRSLRAPASISSRLSIRAGA